MSVSVRKQLDRLFTLYQRARLVHLQIDGQQPVTRILYAGIPTNAKIAINGDEIVVDKEKFHLETHIGCASVYVNNNVHHVENNISAILRVEHDKGTAFIMLGLAYSVQQYDFNEARRQLQRFLQKAVAQTDPQPAQTLIKQFDFDNSRDFVFEKIKYKYLQRPFAFQKQKYTVLIFLDLQQPQFDHILFNYLTFIANPQISYNYIFCIKSCTAYNYESITGRTSLFKQINLVEDSGLCQLYLKQSKQLIIVLSNYQPVETEQNQPGMMVQQSQADDANSGAMQGSVSEKQYNSVQAQHKLCPYISKVCQDLGAYQLFLKQQNIIIQIPNKQPFTFDEQHGTFTCLGVETRMLVRAAADFDRNYTIVIFDNPRSIDFQTSVENVERLLSRLDTQFNRYIVLQGVSQETYNSRDVGAKFSKMHILDQYNLVFDGNNIFSIMDSNYGKINKCCFVFDQKGELLASSVPIDKLAHVFDRQLQMEKQQKKERDKLEYLNQMRKGRYGSLYKVVNKTE